MILMNELFLKIFIFVNNWYYHKIQQCRSWMTRWFPQRYQPIQKLRWRLQEFFSKYFHFLSVFAPSQENENVFWIDCARFLFQHIFQNTGVLPHDVCSLWKLTEWATDTVRPHFGRMDRLETHKYLLNIKEYWVRQNNLSTPGSLK